MQDHYECIWQCACALVCEHAGLLSCGFRDHCVVCADICCFAHCRAATARLDFSALDREVVADQVNKQSQDREVSS